MFEKRDTFRFMRVNNKFIYENVDDSFAIMITLNLQVKAADG